MKYKKFKMIGSIVYLVILIAYAFFLFTNLQPGPNQEDVNVFGKSIYIVDDGSGDAVIANTEASPAKGQKVVFIQNGNTYVGQVQSLFSDHSAYISVEGSDTLQTAPPNAICGVVTTTIPVMGAVLIFFLSAWGIILLVVLPCLAFLVFEVVQLIRVSRKTAKGSYYPGQIEEDDEDEYEDLDTDALSSYRTNRFTTQTQGTEQGEEPAQEDEREEVAQGLQQPNEDNRFRDVPISKFDTLYGTSREAIPRRRGYTALDAVLGELQYKMKFQDTNELSNHAEGMIGQTNDLPQFDKYGLETKPIQDGVQINVDPEKVEKFTLQLRNDGSLKIITDTYEANIDAIV